MESFFIELVLTLGTKIIIENCRRRQKAAFVKKLLPAKLSLFISCQIGHLQSLWMDMGDNINLKKFLKNIFQMSKNSRLAAKSG